MSNPCVIPTMVQDTLGDGRWMSQHKRIKAECQGKEPDVVLIGDSIVSFLSLQPIWNELFAPLHCLNCGIGGDRTEHVLWRIKDGIFENIKPKAVVIHIGTNNIDQPPENVAEGVLEVAKLVREVLPETFILVDSLLPRGQTSNPVRLRQDEVNQIVERKLPSIPRTKFLEIGSDLLQSDGTLSHLDAPDYLHFSEAGYRKSFTLVHRELVKILAQAQPHHA
ncbi:unnamed protein product [Bemisia tabaci]|uniref:SGNH hydrolase-type esterase domain-containing protein n=1 Tax=Bemisia tabaci TaxID=7038 RepID=A0A9P0AIL2_BEMTA|nr:unnamed protein product [Bemisia tabaci]